MPLRSRLVWLAVFLLALASACGGASPGTSGTTAAQARDGTYAIALSRPDRVGTFVRIVQDRTRSMQRTIRFRGEVVDSSVEASSTHLAGVVETLESDARGRALHFALRLEAWEVTTGAGKVDRLRPGQRIEVWRAPTDDAARMLVDGTPADPELKAAFDEIVSLDSDKPNDDDLFGSSTRRAIGESWSIDSAKFATATSAPTLRVDPAATSGTVRVVDRRTEEGIDGLGVAFEVQSSHLELRGIPNLTARGGRLESSGTAFLPLDGELPSPKSDFQMRMEVLADLTTPNGPAQLTIQMTESDSSSAQLLPRH